MGKIIRTNVWPIAAIMSFWVIAIILLSFLFFMSYADKYIEERNAISLKDASKGITQILQTKIESQWAGLVPAAIHAGHTNETYDSDHIINLLKYMKETSNFVNFFISDKSGNTINDQGVRVNISDRYYFKKTMQGYNSMSGILKSRSGGEDVFVFSTPIYGEAKIDGIVGGAIRVEELRGLIDLSLFDGNGYTYIITGDGDVLLRPLLESAPIKEDNVITFLSKNNVNSSMDQVGFRNLLRHRQTGYFTFESNGQVQCAYYMPLEINDWYVICGVPHRFLERQYEELLLRALILCVGVLVALGPVAIIFVLWERERKRDIIKRNKELLLNEERFRIVSSLSNSVIFEADLLTGELLMADEFKIWLGFDPVEEGFPYSVVEAGHIHPDDGEAFINMHARIHPFTDKISGEFRLKNGKGGHSWYRIEERLLLDDNGKAIRAIGRALDIDDEKRAMEMLKTKAKVDSATGLLNKQATELAITQYVEAKSTGIHALILMDIDEFKNINDNKGHLYGDQVIIDLAGILKHQFRATDVVGRVGGDEFMIFIKDIPNDLFVVDKIVRIRDTIRKLHKVTLSIGIAVYPKDGRSYMELYKSADSAMYSVKRNGQDGYGFFIDTCQL